MKFVDEATIAVEAGKGGNGCLSIFLRVVLTVAMVVMVALLFWLLVSQLTL
jgi:flagellar basal body-associated protein FliL